MSNQHECILHLNTHSHSSMLFHFSDDIQAQCNLTQRTTVHGTVLHICSFPPEHVFLFIPIYLTVVDAHTNETVFERTTRVDYTGELSTTWDKVQSPKRIHIQATQRSLHSLTQSAHDQIISMADFSLSCSMMTGWFSFSFSSSVCACVSPSSITELPYPPKDISVERTGEPEQLLVRWKAQENDDYEIRFSSQNQPERTEKVWDPDTNSLLMLRQNLAARRGYLVRRYFS